LALSHGYGENPLFVGSAATLVLNGNI